MKCFNRGYILNHVYTFKYNIVIHIIVVQHALDIIYWNDGNAAFLADKLNSV